MLANTLEHSHGDGHRLLWQSQYIAPHTCVYYFMKLLHILHDLYIIFSSNYISSIFIINGTRIVLCYCLGGGDCRLGCLGDPGVSPSSQGSLLVGYLKSPVR